MTTRLSIIEASKFLQSKGEPYSVWKLRYLTRGDNPKITHYRTVGCPQGRKIEFDKKDLLSYVKQNPSCQVVRAKD